MKVTQTYYTKDIDGEYFVAQPQPTLREMEPEDTDDTMSVAERAVRIVLAKAKGVCLSKVHAIDHAGNSYLREASATQCANAIGALNIQPLIDQVHGILSLPTQPEPHPDDIAVDRFAAAMKAKMARSRDCGRYGWDDPAVCSAEDLRLFLVNHIAKGDPVDVGNFAMMLFNRGESTKPEPPADVARDAEPVAYVTGYYAGYLSIATIDGRALPAGTALYSAPPAPSVPDGWRLVPYTPTVLMLERAEYAVNNRPQPSKYEPSATPAIIFWAAMLNYAPEAPAVQSDLVKDAGRYRWLRAALSDRTKAGKSHYFCSISEGCPEELDEAIDAAIKRQGGES